MHFSSLQCTTLQYLIYIYWKKDRYVLQLISCIRVLSEFSVKDSINLLFRLLKKSVVKVKVDKNTPTPVRIQSNTDNLYVYPVSKYHVTSEFEVWFNYLLNFIVNVILCWCRSECEYLYMHIYCYHKHERIENRTHPYFEYIHHTRYGQILLIKPLLWRQPIH